MKRLRTILLLLLPVAALSFLSSCDQQLDITPFIIANQQGSATIGDTSYVEIFPPWGGFGSPRAILVGNDQLIYVADYDNNQVVMLDAGGAVLKRIDIPHPISLAQNSKLDLYVGGETIAPNGVDTIGAIYRIFLARFDTTYISRIDTVIGPFGDTTIVPIKRDTSYFYDHDLPNAHRKIVWQEASRPRRRFVGIAIFPTNSYVVARNGPDNTSFVDPDNVLMQFTKGDTLLSAIGDVISRPSGGNAITDIHYLTGIMTYPNTRNIVILQNSAGIAYSAIPMTYVLNKDRDGWDLTYNPDKPEQRVDLIRPYRFQNAVAATYDRRRRELFILDADLDSVIKFNSRGQFKAESFGRAVTSENQFPAMNHPMGISFSNDCTLYIADTGNKVVRRFKLSIQTTCF